MSDEHAHYDCNWRAVEAHLDKLRLAHEAATQELVAWRTRLRVAEGNRASDTRAYFEVLDGTRVQRSRVVRLADQIRLAEAQRTLAEAAARGLKGDRLLTEQPHSTADVAGLTDGAQ